ncbi:MAG: outer membrane protein assembly factor BamD [Thermodesulfobacteriota bacterium]|nr:outer membrane protein assembly factor BamD [Thermodesulfobacteriota bacterium]
MDAVTYPNSSVVEFVEENVVPLRLSFDVKPESDDFKVKWTPTLIVLDAEGEEHHRTTGFLGPEELMPMIMLGIGKARFDSEVFSEALESLNRLLAQYPKSDSAPEAIYYRGVSGYKHSHDAGPLKEAYEKLQSEYPSSEWAKRAAPYRLL